MDNVDNPKTFWRACAFGLLGLWKSLGCAGDILGKTAFWRACTRILAARRPGWTAASGRQCGASPPKGRFWPPQKRLSTLSPKALSPKSGEKSPAVTGVLAARPQTFHQVIHRSLHAAGRKRPAPNTLQHYIILCQPTQIKGWAEDGKGFAAPGGQWTKVYFLHFLRTGNAYQGQTENAPASAC